MLVARVVGGVVELVPLEEVACGGGVGCLQECRVSREEGAALLRCRQHLVRVPSDTVRPGRRQRVRGWREAVAEPLLTSHLPLDTPQQVPSPLGHESTAPPSSVHMEPETLRRADIPDLLQRVEGSQHCRPCQHKTTHSQSHIILHHFLLLSNFIIWTVCYIYVGVGIDCKHHCLIEAIDTYKTSKHRYPSL